MTDAREQLLALIKVRAFQKGEFTLASGEKSDYYIDGKMVEVCPEGAALIGEILYQELCELPQVTAIGGLEVGAVPMVAAAMVICHQRGRNVEGFWVRDKVKDHGTKKPIEGTKLKPGGRVLIVDDVITTGDSAFKAIKAVQASGCVVERVFALVDRNRGADVKFAELGCDYKPLFTKDDLFAYEHAR